eukprot:Partr_v1_DN25537_c0_g1_i1_m20618 putative Polysaccharide deacetylase
MPQITPFRFVALSSIALLCYYAFSGEESFVDPRFLGRRAPFSLAEVKNFCDTDGQLALTFDEGPATSTITLLQALARNKIKATFHVSTQYLKDIAVNTNLRSAYESGHVIGIRWPNSLKTADMSESEVKQKLLNYAAAVYTYIGVYPKFLRFPIDDLTDRNVRVAGSLGFICTGYNIESEDYNAASTVSTINSTYINAFSNIYRGKGRFISIHRDLPDAYRHGLIDTLATTVPAYGYNFTTLDACLSETSAYRESNLDPAGQLVAIDETSVPKGTTNSKSTSDASKVAQLSMFALMLVQMLALTL